MLAPASRGIHRGQLSQVVLSFLSISWDFIHGEAEHEQGHTNQLASVNISSFLSNKRVSLIFKCSTRAHPRKIKYFDDGANKFAGTSFQLLRPRSLKIGGSEIRSPRIIIVAKIIIKESYFLFKEWTMSSMRPSNSGCTRIVGRARR